MAINSRRKKIPGSGTLFTAAVEAATLTPLTQKLRRALAAAAIAELPAGNRQKFPIVALGMECQLEHAMIGGIARFAVSPSFPTGRVVDLKNK